MSQWSFFSNHGHVIVLLGQKPDLTYREIADKVGVTQRCVQGIVSDLVEAGFISIKKEGRRNSYIINKDKYFRHEIEHQCRVRDLIKLIGGKS